MKSKEQRKYEARTHEYLSGEVSEALRMVKNQVKKQEDFGYVISAIIMTTVLLLSAGTISLMANPLHLSINLGDILTENLITVTWNAASPDARLQFLGTLIVAIPGLTIIRSIFKKVEK